jgi:rhodanese-related sulfurtransferase
MVEGGEVAFIDVRDQGNYNSTHIPGFSSLARRLIEFDLPWLAPYKGVRLVLCDDDGRQSRLAASTAERMGYSDVCVLEGGVNAWTTANLPTEWGTNVPSKDFGERMEVEHHVPEIDSLELKARLDRGEKIVMLDTRTPEEHRNFCIPGSSALPNGEIPLRIHDIIKEQGKDATVLLHCAGRTRSIIGTRTLQRMGLKNIYGLKNGTAGWTLAGLELERGSERSAAGSVSAEGLKAAEAYSERVAKEDGVGYVDGAGLEGLMGKGSSQTVYLIDVRTEEEYRKGHIPGFRWFPGGQAVQRSDDAATVRDGTIVFACDGKVRATVTASWFRQMGYPKVYVLQSGVKGWAAMGRGLETGMPEVKPFGIEEARRKVKTISPKELAGNKDWAVIFVDTSKDFAAGHVPGSQWVPRGWLEERIGEAMPDKGRPITVTCVNGMQSILAASTLVDMGYQRVAALEGGMGSWRKAGLPLERGLSGVMTPPTDVVVMGFDRSPADTINYLRWEEELGRKYAPN